MSAPEKKSAGDRIITGSFQMHMTLTQNRTCTLSGQFYDDDSLEDKHKRLDEYRALVDRQFVSAELVSLEAQRAARIAALEDHVRKLETLERRQAELQRAAQNGGKRKHTLNSQELQLLEKRQETTEQAGEQIKMLDSMIDACKKKLALSEARA